MEHLKKNSIRLKLIPSLIREQKLNLDSLTDKLNDELSERGMEPVSTRTVGRDFNILKSEGLTIKTQKDEYKKNYFRNYINVFINMYTNIDIFSY